MRRAGVDSLVRWTGFLKISKMVTPISRKKILVLTPRFPYPVIGGDRLRIYNVCKELAKDFSLTLLSMCESKEELAMPIPDDGVFARVERVMLPKWRSLLNVMLALPTATPLQIAYYRSAEFRAKLDELLPDHDACLPHLIRTGDYLLESRIPRILEMTDAISLNYQRVKRLGSGRRLKSYVYALEADRLFKYEVDILKKFDLAVLVSETDRDFLAAGSNLAELGNVMVCSNGVDIDLMPYAPRFGEPNIVFIGNMTTVQNLDACQFFIDDVLPILREKYPFVFKIIGRIGEKDATNFKKYEGVEVMGAVDSVATAASGGTVGVCPVRLGAGVQNKVLEYMALGLPVVSSSIGLEGFAAVPERDLLIADTPDEYVAAILRIFEGGAQFQNMTDAARKYVEEHHSWNGRLSPLRQRVAELLGEQGSEDFEGAGHAISERK
jgi:glycosyltransferase involved in cell wall biosynthesis